MKKILFILLFTSFFSFSQNQHSNDCGFACTHENELAIGLGIIPSHDFSLGFHCFALFIVFKGACWFDGSHPVGC